jgi:glutamyl-tRNA synthetase
MSVRVRFAPSPTGPLHIGGVRTALYNYLFAKKHNGTFILRIEDTDQMRYVSGAEEYILEALVWLGLTPEEGPHVGGKYGPYRQSERKAIYRSYAEKLVADCKAYYAFDTPEELDALRSQYPDDSFKYGIATRMQLKNSLTLSKEQTQTYLESGDYVIRLLIPQDRDILIQDEIRGNVTFSSNELDDKVMLKGDGMPTYHLANIVDDHLMEITHVIRGEEWLSSTAHHVLLYDAFGWTSPKFAHLPLILKPSGQGKLSKRDGAKFGFPVFPLDWNDEEESFPGFREDGMLPIALLNFLALLGWSPGDDKEILSLDEMTQLFTLDRIVKSGARFDIEKAKFFNQQYLIQLPNEEIAKSLEPIAKEKGIKASTEKLAQAASMMKERVHRIQDIILEGGYLFEYPTTIDTDTFNKKFKAENKAYFIEIAQEVSELIGNREIFESKVKDYIQVKSAKMGEILPVLRIALTGTMQGPDLFDTFSILGGEEASKRIIRMMDNN